MIEVRTLLRAANGDLVPLERCEDPPPDPDYIEGAIELTVDGVEIIGQAQWDYVDQLWSYVVSMIKRLRTEPKADTYFPDQPILLAFQRMGSRMLVTAKVRDGTRTANADARELIEALAVAGRAFFGRISELVPSSASSYQSDIAELSQW